MGLFWGFPLRTWTVLAASSGRDLQCECACGLLCEVWCVQRFSASGKASQVGTVTQPNKVGLKLICLQELLNKVLLLVTVNMHILSWEASYQTYVHYKLFINLQ